MRRRRLRVVCSSDEEDDDYRLPPSPPPPPQNHQLQDEDLEILIMDDIETDFQTVTLNSANPTPGSNNSATATASASASATSYTLGNRQVEPIPLYISDEEPEVSITTGDSTDNSFPEIVNVNNGHFEVSEIPVYGDLERLGLRLKREWLDSCLQGLQASVQGFQRLDSSAKAKHCFQQFLRSDMNFCGAGVLPPNVHTLHLVDLKGPFVLQVDEIVNISSPLRGRYQSAAPGIKRCLKLSMTDGVQRVFGLEYRPIKDLKEGPAGLKVAVCNVNIRHGQLMLVPEVVEVLGGDVAELEAARQRLVEEVNKPPRGKRNKTGEVPPLSTRATLAAWPPSNGAVPGHVDRNNPTNVIPLQSRRQASVPANDMHTQDFATPIGRNNAVPNTSRAPWPPRQDQIPGHTDTPIITNSRQGPERPRRESEVPVNRSNAEPGTMPAMQPLQSATISQHINEPSIGLMTPVGGTRQDTLANHIAGEDVNVVSMDDADRITSPIDMDAEEISVVDELERHFILSRDNEFPFMYLASLSAKCVESDDETSVVRGKIKCFLTGVKEFQFRQRSTYELRVYVDDGSLISEILIDHNVVRNTIGYSPHEVTSAVASSDSSTASEMKDRLKQFQTLLINFEGTMVVEMSNPSALPVAVEMDQGCPASDACLLLKRVKSFYSRQQQQDDSYLNPIELSP